MTPYHPSTPSQGPPDHSLHPDICGEFSDSTPGYRTRYKRPNRRELNLGYWTRTTAKPSAPPWIVTYGDTMGLLMCLFIVLFSTSDLQNPEYAASVFGAVRGAFGGLSGVLSGSSPSESGLAARLGSLNEYSIGHDELDASGTRAVRFSECPEGFRIVMSGEDLFDFANATLRPGANERLARVAERLASSRTKVTVRGHTGGVAADAHESWQARDLAYQRAKVVAQLLERGGVIATRLRIDAVGDVEPETEVDPKGNRPDDRIEIVVNRRP